MTEPTPNSDTPGPQDGVVMLPCPFCGSDSIRIVHCEPDCCGAKPIWIECDCGGQLTVSCKNDGEAAAAWNMRLGDRCAGGCVIRRAVKEYAESVQST